MAPRKTRRHFLNSIENFSKISFAAKLFLIAKKNVIPAIFYWYNLLLQQNIIRANIKTKDRNLNSGLTFLQAGFLFPLNFKIKKCSLIKP